eukprot:10101741-Prorocentrum_lima.AAC.1
MPKQAFPIKWEASMCTSLISADCSTSLPAIALSQCPAKLASQEAVKKRRCRDQSLYSPAVKAMGLKSPEGF